MTGYESKRAAARDKLAQPEQEPVAWAVYCDGFIALPAFDDEQDALRKMQRRNKKWPQNKREVKALYDTTPPQRTWVELTESEWFNWWRVSQIADATEAEIDFADFLIIAQAVTAKLKELNNG